MQKGFVVSFPLLRPGCLVFVHSNIKVTWKYPLDSRWTHSKRNMILPKIIILTKKNCYFWHVNCWICGEYVVVSSNPLNPTDGCSTYTHHQTLMKKLSSIEGNEDIKNYDVVFREKLLMNSLYASWTYSSKLCIEYWCKKIYLTFTKTCIWYKPCEGTLR